MEIVGIEEFHFFDLILGIKATEELINREEKANTSLLTTIAGDNTTSDTEQDKQDSFQRKNIKLN